MPVTLFIWGAGRIVPVRVTGLTITEKLYDSALNPIHAEAQLTLRVLTPAELKPPAGQRHPGQPGHDRLHATRSRSARRSRWPTSANAAESIIGMIPH